MTSITFKNQKLALSYLQNMHLFLINLSKSKFVETEQSKIGQVKSLVHNIVVTSPLAKPKLGNETRRERKMELKG